MKITLERLLAEFQAVSLFMYYLSYLLCSLTFILCVILFIFSGRVNEFIVFRVTSQSAIPVTRDIDISS